MNPVHQSEDTIFDVASQLTDPKARSAYLDQACGENLSLRQHLEELLRAAPEADDFFSRGGVDLHQLPTLSSDEATLLVPHSEQVGEIIAHYKLLQQIGEGGFGSVWLAEQMEPVSRRVALKILKLGMDTREVIARFEAERQALAMMDHPNIAKVFEAGATDKGRPFFVMELVKGVPITQYCDEAQLSTRERLSLFGDVCAAIQHAHQKGVIHRDIKPSNVLVALHGDKPVVKVIDFGIAKATQGKLTDKTLFTRFDQFIGTPVYMSPEQANLSGLDVDTRSDIYALGILLYELLTGKPPFDTKTLLSAGYEEMRRIIREVEPPKPSSRLITATEAERKQLAKARHLDSDKLSRLVEPDLDWIVMKAIEKDRRRRYETASGLAQDIVNFLADKPVSATPPSAGYQLRKFIRRKRRTLISAAAVGVALLVGLTVAGWVWLDSSWEKRERVALVDQQASALIREGERRMELNAQVPLENTSHFIQARDLADRIESMLDLNKASEELRARSRRFLADVNAEVQDRKLVAGVEEAIIRNMAKLSEKESEVEGLSGVFAEFKMAPLEHPTETMVAQIQKRRVALQERILFGLAKWAKALGKTEPEKVTKLGAIIERCDSDPWRMSLRKAIASGDRTALEALADSPELGRQPPMTVLLLADELGELQFPGAVEKLLRRAQRETPGSFWTNFQLGEYLAGSIEPPYQNDPSSKTFLVETNIGQVPPGMGKGLETPPKPEFEEAIGFLRAAAIARPTSYSAWLFLGISLASAGHLEEAIASYQQAIVLIPEKSYAHFVLGMALLRQHRSPEAVAAFKQAIKCDPADDSARGFLVMALAESGNDEEALAEIRQAVELQSAKASKSSWAGDQAPKKPFDAGKTYAFVGISQMNRGDTDKALESFRLAIKADPLVAQSHANMGLVLWMKGEASAALLAFERAIELKPDLADAHGGIGLIQQGRGEFDAAIATYKKAIELDPKNAQVYSNLGGALANLGKDDEAERALKKAIELDPKLAMALRNLGIIAEKRNQSEEALRWFEKAVATDPKYADAQQSLANALWKAGKHAEGIEVCRRFVELKQDDPQAHIQLGTSLAKENRFEEALVPFQKAVALNPEIAAAREGLGVSYLKLDRYPEGIDALRHVVRLMPELASARTKLGKVLFLHGDYEEAVRVLVEAVDLEPTKDEHLTPLMAVLLRSGRISAMGLAHGQCVSSKCSIADLVKMGERLQAALQQDGPDAASVHTILSEISGDNSDLLNACLPPLSSAALRRFWAQHLEEVQAAMGTANIRCISLPKTETNEARKKADEIRKRLVEGADFAQMARLYSEDSAAGEGGLRKDVSEGSFISIVGEAMRSLPVGKVSEVIENESSCYILKVESRQAAKSDAFEDPGVEEATKIVSGRQARKDLEKTILDRLQDKKPDLTMARVQHLVGKRYLAAGAPAPAKEFFEKALATLREGLGEKDAEVVRAAQSLADASALLAKQPVPTVEREQAEEDAPTPSGGKANTKLVADLKSRITSIESTAGAKSPTLISPLQELTEGYLRGGQLDLAEKSATRALEIAKGISGGPQNVIANCLYALSKVRVEQANYPEAISLLEQSLNIKRGLLGAKHLEVAEVIDQWGVVLLTQGKLDEAESKMREALAMRKDLAGSEDLCMAASFNNLGIILERQGKAPEAEKMHREALTIRKKQLGDQHSLVATSLNNLASSLLAQGIYSEAEPLLREAMAIQKSVFGKVDPLMLTNLGDVLRKLNRLDEAEVLIREALAADAQLHGSEHPSQMLILNNLALVLPAQGKSAEAEQMLRSALAMGRKILGPDHPSLVSLLTNLAELLKTSNSLPEAEKLAAEAVALARRSLGDAHPNLLASLRTWVQVLMKQGRLEEAESHSAEALAMARKLYENKQLDILPTLGERGNVLLARNQMTDAEKLFREAVQILRKQYGDDYVEVAIALAKLAEVLRDSGQIPEAKKTYKDAIAIFRKLPETDGRFGSALFSFGVLLRNADQPQAAESSAREALEVWQKVGKSADFNMAGTHCLLGSTLADQQKYAEAEAEMRKAVAMGKEAAGGENPAQAGFVNSLAKVLTAQGNHAEAEKFYREALEMRKILPGDTKTNVLQSLADLMNCLLVQEKHPAAEPVAREALAILRGFSKEDSTEVLTWVGNLAVALNGQAKYSEAEQILTSTLQQLGGNRDDKREAVAQLLIPLADAQSELQQLPEAEATIREALGMWIKLRGEDNRITLICQGRLARVLDDQKQYKEAEPIYRKALDQMETLHGPNHPEVSAAMAELANNLRVQGGLDEAETLYQRSLKIQKSAMGMEHPATLCGLAKVLRDKERFEEADSLFKRALGDIEKTTPAGHPNIAKVLAFYAGSLVRQKKFDEAKPLAERALAIQEKALKPGHPDQADTLELLSKIHTGLGDTESAKTATERAAAIREGDKITPPGKPEK